VLQALRHAVDRWGQTALMVTHDPVAAAFADSVVFLADGRLAGQLTRPDPAQVAERMTHLGDRATGQARDRAASHDQAAGRFAAQTTTPLNTERAW
jgi:ABC-type lipoprotein export system ATPase subunit